VNAAAKIGDLLLPPSNRLEGCNDVGSMRACHETAQTLQERQDDLQG
jgi:hypothetical protein